jgi:glycerol-3-phosphate dehydrogenase (NAD(P)+)
MGTRKSEVAVIGSGSWATGIVKLLSENCDTISWYIREAEIISHLEEHNHNPKFLSSVSFDPQKLMLTGDINEAVANSDTIILVVPSAFLKSTLENLRVDISQKTVCSAIKGIVPGNNTIVGDFMHKQYNVPYENLVVLSGPTHAEEIAMEKLSYLTVASLSEKRAGRVAALLNSFYLRTVLSNDIFGTEYAAVLKNIYAIAIGVAHGLGYGDNFQAVLLSNCASEMNRFVKKVYKNKRNITASAYLGDLLVTAYSQFSRNRMLGNMLGKGTSVKYALTNMTMIAEGYFASECIFLINKELGARIPIADAVYNILYNEMNPSEAIEGLTEMLK